MRCRACRKRQAEQPGGEWTEETTFVDVTLWKRAAEVCGEYLSKGSPVLIEGRLKLETWETDGQKRSKLKVIGERMQMLGKRPQNENGSTPTNGNGDTAAEAALASAATDADAPF